MGLLFGNYQIYSQSNNGLTPLKGIGLRKEDYPNSMAEAGPICKKAEDLISILKIIIGEKASLLNLDAEVDIRCLNIFYQESSGDIRTSSVNWEMRTALLKAVQHFKEITGSATKSVPELNRQTLDMNLGPYIFSSGSMLPSRDIYKVVGLSKIEIPDSEYSYRLWRFWITQENFDIKLSITNGKV
ncbi:hypothetical protein K0M31_012599 [Melipona bicolor]|uniref:Uncharacterized protein n=1 Tax=Melipona bicolor TaxID=60889 RepID=A0AA40FJG3_9HYME|nr:hypothetical protein K0M31_012599 [Melipona bicolor]